MNRHEQAIEAAATALYTDINPSHAKTKGWDDVTPRWKESYRKNARAAHAAYCKAFESGNEPTRVPRKDRQ